MRFEKTIQLKNGAMCLIRNAEVSDASEVLRNSKLTHEETEFLFSYLEESKYTVEGEKEFLKKHLDSERSAELCAFTDGKLVGCAGINPIGEHIKVLHRASFGIAIEKAYWGLGIGRALTLACIELGKRAGYLQLELDAVAENESALNLYRSCGFGEFGRNPMGFRKKDGNYQELVSMRLEL